MADMTFETKFAKIVENELNSKLPALKDYHVGFQLLDKAEDETKAIGINAFLVNGVLVYNPCFFLNGQFKGLDLLYIQPKDMFVPAVDNWIVAIKDQTQNVLSLGNAINPSSNVKKFSATEVPLDEILYSSTSLPLTKTAEANAFVTDKDITNMTAGKGTDAELSLLDTLKTMPKEASDMFFATLGKNADFANAVLKFYSMDDLNKMCKEAGSVGTEKVKEVEKVTPDVTVIDKLDHKDAPALTPKEKTLFMHNGVFVKDTRARHSVLFQHEFKKDALQTPQHDGVYDVLMNNGMFEPFAVFTNLKKYDPESLARPSCCAYSDSTRDRNNASGRRCALVPLSQSTKYFVVDADKLMVRPSEKYVEHEQPKSGIGKDISKTSLLKMLSEAGNKDFGQQEVLLVQPDFRAFELRIDHKGDACINGTCQHLEFTGKPGKLSAMGGILTIPQGIKAFTKMSYKDSNKYMFGDLSTINRVIRKEAGVHALKVYNRSGNVTVQSAKISKTMDKLAAIKHLTMEEGLAGGQVMNILKEAERAPSNKTEYFIKYAAEYDVENAPGVRNEVSRVEQSGPIEVLDRHTGQAVMPQQFVSNAVAASEQGSRQVFDVSVLNNLLRAADIGTMRKTFLKDMIKGMDKVGRLLFVFYWHQNEFEDRYGKDDLNDLEDKLKQVFKETGDLILFLKEKVSLVGETEDSLSADVGEDTTSELA